MYSGNHSQKYIKIHQQSIKFQTVRKSLKKIMSGNINGNAYQSSYYEKFKNLFEIYEQFKLTNSCQDAIISIQKYSMNSQKSSGYSPNKSKENKFYQYKGKQKLLRSTHQPCVDTSLNNVSNLSNVKSDKKFSNQLLNEAEELRKQNQLLKQQVKFLKSCLGYDAPIFQTENDFFTKITKLETEKSHLKKIIQKSYYSLKDLQKENDKLVSEQTFLREKSTQVAMQLYTQQQKLSFIQAQNYNIRNNIQNLSKLHQDEIQFLYERIHKLEKTLDQMSQYMEVDNRQWKKQQQQLQVIKKNYRHS